MKNNKVRLIGKDEGERYTVIARNKLIRAYNAHRENGGWRAVRDEIGIRNVATVYNFAMHGTEPKNMEERKKLGLKKRCPTCNRAIKENGKTHIHRETPEFMKIWNKQDKKLRYRIIIEGLREHGII